jgi:Flp pilus assembly protein TadD
VALTYQQYADLALRFGDMDIALEQAQKAVSLDATDGIAFGIIGWSQLQAGNSSAAHSAFEQAVRWQPDSADFHLGLATAYFQQGRTVEAHQALQRSLALDPDYAPALTLRLQLSDN